MIDDVQIDTLAERSGIFRPEGQNADLVFGFCNSDTHVTGITTGQKNSWLFPAFFRAEITKTSGQEKWSGRRGSNPRPQAWEACALPTELHPHFLSHARLDIWFLSRKCLFSG